MAAPRTPPAWIAVLLEALLRALTRERGELEKGRRGGVWTRTFPGGEPMTRTTYLAGRRHGPCTRWYLGGRKRFVGEYRQGEQSGEWFFFTRDGRLDGRRTGMYEKGLRYGALKGFNDWNA